MTKVSHYQAEQPSVHKSPGHGVLAADAICRVNCLGYCLFLSLQRTQRQAFFQKASHKYVSAVPA